jgi:hypothetical protein
MVALVWALTGFEDLRQPKMNNYKEKRKKRKRKKEDLNWDYFWLTQPKSFYFLLDRGTISK